MMRAETPQTPRRERFEAACEGDNKRTSSPVPRQNSRMPVKIQHTDVCCSPTPCDKENMPPTWENSCVMELNPLSEATPCKADTSAGAEDDSDLAILQHMWVGDSPHAQSPYQPAGEEDDKEVEPDSLRRLLGPPKVRNTFLHYHSPLKTVKVMTPPNTVPPHFAPRTRLASPPARPRILSPGPSPVPPNGVLRLFDFLPDLPPEGHCNVPPAPGQNTQVGNWCPSYQGTNADFTMPDFFGLPWDASMYSQDMPSGSNVLQPLAGMEGLQSQASDLTGMAGTGSQSMMSWTGPAAIGSQMSGTTTYQQCQYTGQTTQTGLQSTTPGYQGMQQLPQQTTTVTPPPHALQMSSPSQAAAVPQQLQQVQAQLQQLTLQLQQQAQMTQQSTVQQMQQQIQQLQAQVQMCQDLGRASAGPGTTADASGFSTNTSPQVTPFSAPLEPPFQQWSQLSVVDPPASHADQSIAQATLPLQQQLEQVVAGRVNMPPGHFTEVSDSGSANRAEGSSQSVAGPARTSSSPSPSGSDARVDPLSRAEVGDRAIRGKMGRMGRRR